MGGGDTEHEYDEHDEGLDEISELGTGGVDEASGWSETSPARSDFSLTQKRPLGDHPVECDFGVGSSLPINVGTMSLTSWDAGSEPNLGTDAGTDQDIAAASGLPEEDSDDDDDEDDDEFEVADSLDLGAVALCVSVRFCFEAPYHLPRSGGWGLLLDLGWFGVSAFLVTSGQEAPLLFRNKPSQSSSLMVDRKRLQEAGTGADGQQTYQDAARTPQAMRHMTTKLGVEQVGAAYNVVGQIRSLITTLA